MHEQPVSPWSIFRCTDNWFQYVFLSVSTCSHQKRSFLPPQTIIWALLPLWLHPLWKWTGLLCVFSTRALLLQGSICQTRDSKTCSPSSGRKHVWPGVGEGRLWREWTLSCRVAVVWMGCGSVVGPSRGSIEEACVSVYVLCPEHGPQSSSHTHTHWPHGHTTPFVKWKDWKQIEWTVPNLEG